MLGSTASPVRALPCGMLFTAPFGALIDDPGDAHRSGSGGVVAAQQTITLTTITKNTNININSTIITTKPPQTRRGARSPSPLAPFGGYDGIGEALDEHG